ncbi:hypothetical protein OVS_03205 [Mycoplasma ovis str. Michigan]|uniref:Uncharacterized protein n=1 Tax=Mycoplasma ovis str. Michigan TaxID=1415773 RepID=A0ABM5P1W1_9MOLU|nr:hypothetical protein [Mycoplasma ovis]AHC40394.1 hypothetical protein OVS_03205 [Mycoplasma ovis str. Michigan]
MIHWNPSSEVLDGTGDVKIEKPDNEQLIESSKCQVSSGWQENWNWKIVCLTK